VYSRHETFSALLVIGANFEARGSIPWPAPFFLLGLHVPLIDGDAR
jgi:hypothetical protein